MSKTKPINRDELKQYAKIQLGLGAHRINVTDDQMETRLEQALDLFNEFHFDATERVYMAQKLTAQDQARGYVMVPEYVQSVTSALNFRGTNNNADGLLWFPGGGIPSVGWISSGGYVAGGYGSLDPGGGPYGLDNSIMMYLVDMTRATYEEIMHHEASVRFNKDSRRLFFDVDRSYLVPETYVCYEAYTRLCDTNDPGVWNNGWLKRYYTALVKVQWGENVSKFIAESAGPGLPVIDSQRLREESRQEEAVLRQELMTSWTAQPMMWIG